MKAAAAECTLDASSARVPLAINQLIRRHGMTPGTDGWLPAWTLYSESGQDRMVQMGTTMSCASVCDQQQDTQTGNSPCSVSCFITYQAIIRTHTHTHMHTYIQRRLHLSTDVLSSGTHQTFNGEGLRPIINANVLIPSSTLYSYSLARGKCLFAQINMEQKAKFRAHKHISQR